MRLSLATWMLLLSGSPLLWGANALLPVPGTNPPTVLEHLAPVSIPAAQAPDIENPCRDAVELTIRDGLPNFFSKVHAGGKIAVAYFGGSITEANGWRPQSMAWLRQRYPKAEFTEINAAIGGTGSDLGVFRLQRDVLAHNPDLVFVEFTVNDGGAAPEQIYACMEGIVRQIRHADPKIDVYFVYTLHENMIPALKAGHFSRSASAMEFIANRYGIPSIHLAQEAAQRIISGEWVFTAPKPEVPADPATGAPAKKAFSADSCHPFPETGHKLYTDAVARSFDKMESAGQPGFHSLPNPFATDNHENAKFVPLTSELLGTNWTKLDTVSNSVARVFVPRIPVLWRADAPGATLHFRFHGRYAAVYDLLGPDGGDVEVIVDGRAPQLVRRFDTFCTYHRLGSLVVLSEKQVADHEVTIRLTGNPIDKAAILQPNKIDDPMRFAPLRWYAGALLIDGELARQASQK